MAGCRAAASRVGLRSHCTVLQRPPSREHRGWLLFVARENFEGPTNFQRTSKHKKPKGRPELSEVLSNQAGVCDRDPMCTKSSFREEPENRRKKCLVLRWTDEGFPPSPLAAMSLKEAEAPELVRFFNKYQIFASHLFSFNETNEPGWMRIFLKSLFLTCS